MIRKIIQNAAALGGVRLAKYQPERYDPFALQKLLCPSPVDIFDIGANVGQTAKRYRELYPDARIHCFEPNPVASDQIERDGRTKVYPFAVSNEAKDIELYVGEHIQECSVSKREGADTVVKAKSIIIDCHDFGDQLPQIIKIDVEGHELAALYGACRVIKQQRPLIFAEVSYTPRIPGGCLFTEVASYLHSLGYVVAGLFNLGYHRCGVLSWGDAVFIHKSRANPIDLEARSKGAVALGYAIP